MATIKFKRTAGTTGPTGLTYGEPAFVQGINSFYVTNSAGTSVRVGAEVDATTTLGAGSASDNKLPTQLAVKTYVDNQVAGGAVSSVNGLTGAITLRGGGTYGVTFTIDTTNRNIWVSNIGVTSAVAGAGVSVSGATGTVTISNTGVTGIVNPTTLGGGTYGIQISQQTGSVIITNTGVSAAAAGTGISVSGATGTVTISNTGVTSISGTTNQITASGSTGTVTLSLPSAIVAPGSLTTTGNLTVGGDLIVNGTTTTVNSTTVVVQDPVIVLGGTVGVNDTKDRGIQFNYGGGNTGFFGYDNSLARFIMYTSATNTSEVFTGTTGDAGFASLYLGTGANTVRAMTTTLTGNRTTVFPDWDGNIVAPSGLGSSNNIIKSNGASQPTWIDPTASGFTAFFATNATNLWGGAAGSLHYQSGANTSTFLTIGSANTILRSTGSAPAWLDPTVSGFTAYNASTSQTSLIVSDVADTAAYIAFVNANSDSYQSLKYNAGLTYNAVSNILTVTQIEAIVDGGAY